MAGGTQSTAWRQPRSSYGRLLPGQNAKRYMRVKEKKSENASSMRWTSHALANSLCQKHRGKKKGFITTITSSQVVCARVLLLTRETSHRTWSRTSFKQLHVKCATSSNNVRKPALGWGSAYCWENDSCQRTTVHITTHTLNAPSPKWPSATSATMATTAGHRIL